MIHYVSQFIATVLTVIRMDFVSRVGSIAEEKPIDGSAFTLPLNIACKHEASKEFSLVLTVYRVAVIRMNKS